MNAHLLQPSQTVPPPPGGITTPTQAPPPTLPATGPNGGAPPAGGSWVFLIAFLPLLLVMLWTGRSQQRKQKDLESKLKKGDRVQTQSGIIGRLVEFGDARHVKIEIAPGVKVQMLKSAITGVEADPDVSGKAKEESAAGDKKS